jgi:uncharacterized membrane protein
MDSNNKKYLIFCFVLLCCAAALRFYNLGSEGIWLDEAYTLNLAFDSFDHMLEVLRGKGTGHSAPILFPTILWLFQDIIRDPFFARIWSVIFGLGAVGVLLCLPAAGIPKRVAALSAIILTFSGTQIQYSQEVREYMMGVFFSSLLLLLFLMQLKESGGIASYISLFVTVLIAPFVTYGLIFLSVILIAFYSLHILLHERKKLWRPITLIIGFAVSLRICFLLTIVYTQNIPKYSIYDSFYPSGGIIDASAWLVKSVSDFINFPLGFSGGLILILIWGLSIFLFKQNSNQEPESRISKMICLLLSALTLFMLLLAFLHRYPFAGSRHLLFVSPLVIVCFALSFDFLWRRIKGPYSIYYWVVPLLLVLMQASNLKAVYADLQDVVSPVKLKPADMPDQDVFIDFWGVPSIQYYFPDHDFTECKSHPSQLGKTVEEINAMPASIRLVILSERSLDEVRQMEVMLNRTNSKVEFIRRYKEGFPTQTFVFLVTR